MSAPLAIVEVGEGAAEELSEFSTMAYVAAFGAGFDDPADLQHHVTTSLSAEAWRRYLQESRVFAARSGAQMLGFLQLGQAAQAGEFEIRRLYVHPERQNAGIGAALMQHALDDPAIAAAPAVWLDVWHDNHRAQKFYQRFGFEMTGDRHAFVLKSGKIDGYDLVMVRRQAAP